MISLFHWPRAIEPILIDGITRGTRLAISFGLFNSAGRPECSAVAAKTLSVDRIDAIKSILRVYI